MEIKSVLNKPYTEKQRTDFIIEQNHSLGYELKETDIALESWGYTEEELEEINKQQEKENRITELEKYLSNTDWYAIRFADTSEEIPTDIKIKRQQAREEISSLRGDN